MTNKEAIDLLDNLIGMVDDNHDSDYDIAIKMAIKALEQESKTEWIPCNKKLPDKSGDYLTTVRVKSTNKTFMDISNLDADGIIKKWDWVEEYEVLAWMPLPPIYKTESEDK